jgi:hypothetical protein
MSMLQQPLHTGASITLLTPECEAPGCHIAGDQFTMVRCCRCKSWFCPDHIAAEEGITLERSDPRALVAFTYYQGLCVPCQQVERRTRH